MITINYSLLYSEVNFLPKKMTQGSSGYDLITPKDLHYKPFEIKVIPLGFKIELPFGYEGQIRPRSSMSKNNWLVPFGTIDSDYRGEIKVTLKNISNTPRYISKRDRIAQLVICKVEPIEWIKIEQSNLSKTDRGSGGFGSTGK